MQFTTRTLSATAIVTVALVAGCIPSLFPIYTEQDVVTRDEVLGEWANDPRTQTWEFSKGDGKAYELVIVDEEGRQSRFIAHFTTVSDTLFMDLFPVRSDENQAGFYKLHLVSAHTFYRVTFKNGKLGLSFLNPQWLKQHQLQHPDELLHARQDGSVLLTADTEQLRAFVAKYLNTANAFTDPFVLSKVAKE